MDTHCLDKYSWFYYTVMSEYDRIELYDKEFYASAQKGYVL